MGIYVGVNGTPKEITALYVGVNEVPKECTDVYVGVNGVSKSCYSGVKPGETVFTSSTKFTVPKGVKKIDVFCVGGGGAGDGASYQVFHYSSNQTDDEFTRNDLRLGAGGDAGYTNTLLGVDVNPGQQLSVVVGTGAQKTYRWYTTGTEGISAASKSLVQIDGVTSVSADGAGSQGKYWYGHFIWGGSSGGGSVGSQSVWDYIGETGTNTVYNPNENSFAYGVNNGGTNGGNGTGNFNYGQGTTTRYFGESTGTLYAGGGRSLGCNIESRNDGNAGTGNGADSINYNPWNSAITRISKGGSGICIIRWGK